MTRTLYLHCGPAKTGTSAIQAVLRSAPPPGLTYPATGQWSDGAHHKLVFAMRGQTARGTIDIPPFDTQLTALAAELDAAPGDVVISSEALTPQDVMPFMTHLRGALTHAFDDIRAIVTLRHPLERAASAYNQNLKDMTVDRVPMPVPYLERNGANFCLMPQVRAWQWLPLPVSFLAYAPADTLVQRFLDLIGHAPAAPLDRARHNRSINGFGLVTLLAARQAGLTPAHRIALFQRLRNGDPRSIWAGASFPFPPQPSRSFITTHVQPDLADVKRLTGITLPDRLQDLPQRFHLTPEEAAEIRDLILPHPEAAPHATRLDNVLRHFTMQNRTSPAQNRAGQGAGRRPTPPLG